MIGPCPRHEVVVMAVRKADNTLFHFLSKSFLILKFCASSAASPLTGVWYCRIASHWGLVLT